MESTVEISNQPMNTVFSSRQTAASFLHDAGDAITGAVFPASFGVFLRPPRICGVISRVSMAATESKTETNVPPATDNVSEVSMAATKSKTETNVPPTTDNVSEAKEIPAAATESKTEAEVPPTTDNVSEIRTVNVSNISSSVTERDIWEFFSFSGNIHYIEMKSESETTRHALVTFRESQGAKTALLLTGATIGDLPVSLSPVENYQLPAGAPPLTQGDAGYTNEVAQKAEEVVSTMLAKGFILGKDALEKAKVFDEKHQVTSNASATVASIDRKMGITEKLNTGTAVVNEKMKEVDERYQVSEKASNAGSAIMSNKYVSSGAVWVAGAFAAVAKAAEGVGSKTKEKIHEAEEEKEGSKTKDKVQKAKEGSSKDAPVTPDKSSNENKELPKQ